MKKRRKVRLKSEPEKDLFNSLDTYIDNLKSSPVITRAPNSNVVVLHLPKSIRELVCIDRKELDAFLNNITALISQFSDLVDTLKERSNNGG